jgi:predicted DNA-binding transcriptional regulator AlpA
MADPAGQAHPELLTTAEVAALLRVNRSTVCRWRLNGSGPRVIWLSPSIPRYERQDVLDWLERAAA